MTLRRMFALALVAVGFTAMPVAADDFATRAAALEKRHGGKLGIAAIDLADGRQLGHRADERFAMCSTFKLLLAAAVAARVDAGAESWDRQIPYGQDDLLSYAPVTGKPENVKAAAMSVAALCAASMQHSDNTAANLLLESIGGPPALNRFLRKNGDDISRLDRIEPDLNSNLPGDPRDTTTPRAMVDTMAAILIGDALSQASRERLTGWMTSNRTGDKRLRAAMEANWKTGDKTGTGENGAVNDVAIIWPGERPPFLIAVFYTGSSATPEEREKVIADAGRLVRNEFAPERAAR